MAAGHLGRLHYAWLPGFSFILGQKQAACMDLGSQKALCIVFGIQLIDSPEFTVLD